MRSRGLILLLLPITFCINAQSFYRNWYFGNFAGLSFKTSPPSVLLDSRMSTVEGCSSISDSLGNLLFYTDGSTVWNKNHDTMVNGAGLISDFSSTQAALIVNMPNNPSKFYIFTTDAINLNGFSDTNRGVYYSIVDMSLNGGLGEVITKNVLMFKSSNEKITAVSHSNKLDVWVASIKRNSDSIYVYKLTEYGLTGPIIQRNVGNIIGNDLSKAGVGQMKFSSNGKYVAYAESGYDRKIHLMDFDDKTGLFSNSRKLINVIYSPYGIEFSPNGKFLYVSTSFPGGVYQVPVDSIKGSISFDSFSIKLNTPLLNFRAMQLAPDGKIYIAVTLDSFLSVINNPDSLGLKSDLAINSINLKGRLSYHGLPNCVQSQIYFPIQIQSDTTCWLDSAQFVIKNTDIKSVTWDFGDGVIITGNSKEIKHLYKDSGTYSVNTKITLPNNIDTTVFSSVRIEYIHYPLLGKDTTLCIGDSLTLNVSNAFISHYLWNDGSQSPIKRIKTSGLFYLKVSNTFCEAFDSIKIYYGKKPIVYLGSDTAFCHKFNHLLDAGKGFKSYLWNTGENTYSINVNTPGNYSVQVLDSLACKAGDTIRLDELKNPKILSSLDSQTCQFVQLTVDSQNNTNYLWNTGDTTTSVKVFKKGHYIITASNKFCSISDTFLVALLPKPLVSLGPDTMICNRTTLSTNETGHYQWNDGQVTPSIQVYRPGIYWLKVSRNNCESIDTIVLKPCNEVTYFIPNAFSPNGDVINESFRVIGTNIESIHMQIFNSWGELLFDANGEDPVWDGSFENKTCPQGVYLYLVEIKGYNSKRYYLNGTVSLLR